VRTNPRQFGAIRNEPGNLCLRETAWWGWEDSNFGPNDYHLRQHYALKMRGASILDTDPGAVNR
jgi:hypothetical protein